MMWNQNKETRTDYEKRVHNECKKGKANDATNPTHNLTYRSSGLRVMKFPVKPP